MAKSTVGMLERLGGQIEALAGTDVRQQVMAGSERFTARTKDDVVAIWVKGAIDRLDSLVPPETGIEIMESCGASCACVNSASIKKAKERRNKFPSEDSFLEAEVSTPITGTRLERRGNVLYQSYTPRSYSRPMRCYCTLLWKLPMSETMSPTYCNCSRGFVKSFWEQVLGRPVEVEVVRSAVTGDTECEFKITLV